MLYRVPMNIIEMSIKIILISNHMFPEGAERYLRVGVGFVE